MRHRLNDKYPAPISRYLLLPIFSLLFLLLMAGCAQQPALLSSTYTYTQDEAVAHCYDFYNELAQHTEKVNYPGPAGEYGWTGAAGTMFFVNPKLEMGGLLLVQHMPGNIYTLRPEFRKAVYATL